MGKTIRPEGGAVDKLLKLAFSAWFTSTVLLFSLFRVELLPARVVEAEVFTSAGSYKHCSSLATAPLAVVLKINLLLCSCHARSQRAVH